MRRRKRRLAVATAVLTAWAMLAAVPALASAPTVTSDVVSGHVFDTPRPTFTGHATDDSIVARVEIAIRLEDPFLWLQPDGSLGPSFSRRSAVLTQRSAPATDWSWAPRSDLPDGEYRLWVAAYDDAGNRTTLKPQARFTIATDGEPTPFFVQPILQRDGFRRAGVFGTSEVTLEGSAVDEKAVERVVVGIRHAESKLWLQPDGSFGPTIRKFHTELTDPGAKVTRWSFSTTLPDGRYVVSVRAFDDEDNSDSLRPWRAFTVDSTGPTIDVAFPFGASLLGPDVVLNGRLEDETLVGAPKVAIKDVSTGLWLQPDGTFGERHRKMKADVGTCRPDKGPFCLPGTPNEGDETISAWLFEVQLPPGGYLLSVRAWDFYGNVSSLKPWRYFEVDPGVDTLPTPSTDVAPGDVFTDSVVRLTGSATDDLGIARVRVGIKDRDTGMWWNGWRFTDRIERFDAVVDERGVPETTWTTEQRLPNGRYALSVRAFDVQGYSQPIRPWIKFEVESDGPQVDVAFLPWDRLRGPEVVLNGRLVDKDGVADATVAVVDHESGLWLQADGSFGVTRADLAALLSTCVPDGRIFCLPGEPSGGGDTVAAWSMTLSLPDGLYGLYVTARDELGEVSTLDDHVLRVFAGFDTLPRPFVRHPDPGQVLSQSDITFEGTALDDIGIARVLVEIRDRDSGHWWDGSGFHFAPVRHDATLGRPGQSTSWTLAARLPDGRYWIFVRAFDVQGFSRTIPTEIPFEVDTS